MPVRCPIFGIADREVTVRFFLERVGDQIEGLEAAHGVKSLGHYGRLHAPLGGLEVLWKNVAGTDVLGCLLAIRGTAKNVN